ncbi:hypothetical protein [Croceicoccus naphthovorans]|uniref:hypothetical protein n=1 Tax=Croceicoccus naphthovorans TaxID=1348774 RepID=UPI00069F791C|nr:hypothetical protein [Croceicoccus naphthovorans]MBB3989036.1 hypothetical protein [Croceicoccus naphthovorans]
MTARTGRGQPLIALAGLIVLWVAARAWGPVGQAIDAPLPLPPTVAGRVEQVQPVIAPIPARSREFVAPVEAVSPTAAPTILPVALPPAPPAIARPALVPLQTVFDAPSLPTSPTPPPPQRRDIAPPAPVPFGAVPPEVRARRRWSADAWMLLRDKAEPGAALVGSGTYGASQAGAVLRYRLFPESGFDPRAYLRVTTTVGGEDEKEVAAGIAVRPLRALPVDLMVEGRLLRFNGDRRLRPSETRVRPAAMAVFGPPVLPLPLDVRAEAYAQIGYVGGEGASAFADGQLRVVRDVPFDLADTISLEAGLGGWGGAQKGVERVDVGPTVAARFPLGKSVFGRASIDWRHRMVGDAEPGSGPVLTLSAGF